MRIQKSDAKITAYIDHFIYKAGPTSRKSRLQVYSRSQSHSAEKIRFFFIYTVVTVTPPCIYFHVWAKSFFGQSDCTHALPTQTHARIHKSNISDKCQQHNYPAATAAAATPSLSLALHTSVILAKTHASPYSISSRAVQCARHRRGAPNCLVIPGL